MFLFLRIIVGFILPHFAVNVVSAQSLSVEKRLCCREDAAMLRAMLCLRSNPITPFSQEELHSPAVVSGQRMRKRKKLWHGLRTRAPRESGDGKSLDRKS